MCDGLFGFCDFDDRCDRDRRCRRKCRRRCERKCERRCERRHCRRDDWSNDWGNEGDDLLSLLLLFSLF
ncbi:hypothetical protein [Clostridium sp. UBA6640]|uniref:hypothetical protein n=1 Tax=Clostridium sp. UBA6640 TaxID=1946370 RepID=UPI0025B959AC|nr:hypothetical protein [Clostridium sp. UBA6640]